jgi:hypothetical protein
VKLVSNFSMSDSSEKENQIKRFKDAIKKKWNCVAEPDKDNPFFCDLSPIPRRGYVYVFNLPQPPAEHPVAKRCFAWIGRSLNSDWNDGILGHDDKGDMAVLDAQVPCDDDLSFPRMAVWAWRTGNLVNEKEADYLESKKWQRDKLHNRRVEFDFNNMIVTGTFFVRQRADGKISVRIVHAGDFEIEGIQIKKLPLVSIGLGHRDIEHGIEAAKPGSDIFSFRKIS